MTSAGGTDDAGTDDDLTVSLERFVSFLSDEGFYSLVSIACLLVAVIYSWKLLKGTPQIENQRRRQMRPMVPSIQTSGTESSFNISSNREFCSSSAESSGQDIVNAYNDSVKPTLGQLLSRKLCGGRKLTCQILGVILEEKCPEDLQESATVKPAVLEVLSEMSKICEIYLMERVLDDSSEERVISALRDAGVFTSCGLNREKVLFCSTENGRASFVRQLEPDWHIDTNPDVIHQLARFIKYQVHISPIKPDRPSGHIFSAPSLELFFGPFEKT